MYSTHPALFRLGVSQRDFDSIEDAHAAAVRAGWVLVHESEARFDTFFIELIEFAREDGRPFWRWVSVP